MLAVRKLSANTKRLILQLPTVTLSTTRMWVSIQFIQNMKRSGNSTKHCQSPFTMFKCWTNTWKNKLFSRLYISNFNRFRVVSFMDRILGKSLQLIFKIIFQNMIHQLRLLQRVRKANPVLLKGSLICLLVKLVSSLLFSNAFSFSQSLFWQASWSNHRFGFYMVF